MLDVALPRNTSCWPGSARKRQWSSSRPVAPKMRYATLHEARAALEAVNPEQAGEVQAYLCPDCGLWHIGSRPLKIVSSQGRCNLYGPHQEETLARATQRR